MKKNSKQARKKAHDDDFGVSVSGQADLLRSPADLPGFDGPSAADLTALLDGGRRARDLLTGESDGLREGEPPVRKLLAHALQRSVSDSERLRRYERLIERLSIALVIALDEQRVAVREIRELRKLLQEAPATRTSRTTDASSFMSRLFDHHLWRRLWPFDPYWK